MARGSATEDDIASGIKAVGVLSAVAGTPRRRDNPFAGDVSAVTPPPSTTPPKRQDAPPLPPSDPPAPKAAVEETLPEKPPRASATPRKAAPEEVAPALAPSRFTDPVTVPLTAEMRTRATLLAAELQRRRTDRTNRFTANSVFRVAIEIVLSRFELRPGDRIDSEEELLALVLERLTPRS
jgi:hypothetical protein